MEKLGIYKDEEENLVTLNIAGLLEKADYDSAWIKQEESDTVFEIRNICDAHVLEGKFVDIQLWEEGNATVGNIDLYKIDELVKALEEKFGKLEVWEG
jgi:chromosome condensin MukBEF complex kleisin-like MukF subunit